MKRSIGIVLISLFISSSSYSQNFYDSIIAELNVERLEGNVPTFYTPGNKKVAFEFQRTILDAIKFYEENSSEKFNIKLAVLDSTQWPRERVPFGFVFYSGGWIFMNTGMTYNQFKKVYGLGTIYKKLDSELKESGISTSEMITSFYTVYAIHELGHYYISQISNAKSPDRWTNEFIATYFSYNFFKTYSESSLMEFELFHRVHKDSYKPTYSSIEDFNTVYMGMGVENYVWYHSNFYFLVESLYNCFGSEFIGQYEELFPKTEQKEYNTSEIIKLLDKNCNNVVENWVDELGTASKK